MCASNGIDPQVFGRRHSFGYVCRRCLKCCHHKRIQLNPYEVARLALNRGLSTTGFRAAWTEDGAGLVLRQTETGACVFLGGDGCSVHPDRPLVCRLYPLGRHVLADGSESFSHVEPHPQSLGEFINTGTIADFLQSQGAGPFMEAADAYFFWLCTAHEHSGDIGESDPADISKEDAKIERDLLDIDAAIARRCMTAEIAEPIDIEARKHLQLTILYQQLEGSRRTTP